MREPGEVMTAGLPKPGRALRVVLILLAAIAIAGAVVVHWAPGGPTGFAIWSLLAFDASAPLSQPWGILTSGLLTIPKLQHPLWSLLGLYFLTPDLERRWGAARLVRFLIASIVLGNLAVLLASRLPIGNGFHSGIVMGPLAAITATAVAWSKENWHGQARYLFFLPMSGRGMFWLTVGLAVLSVVFVAEVPEGAVAPLGGVLAGVLLSGSPSPVRSAWLRMKLALLRRKGPSLTVESVSGSPERARAAKRSGKSPPLRVVYGGLEDELKNRKPPKDKRYLN